MADLLAIQKKISVYQWYKFNSEEPNTTQTFNFTGVNPSDLGNYKVKVSNEFGAVVIPVTLSEGGIPATWNGASFELPAIYSGNVDDNDRNLNFAADYNDELGDIEACNCFVPAGKTVTIGSGSTLKLFDEITVEPSVTITDDDGNETIFSEGVFILENNANLNSDKGC